MRKKFTMLLAALLLGLGATNAQVTKYYKPGERKATFTAGDKVMFYNTALVLNDDRTGISQDRTGFLIGTTSFALDKQKPKNAPIFSEKVGVFTVETVDDQSTYYKVNVKGANGYVGIGGAVNNANASTLCFHKWTTVADNKKTGDDVASENATGEGFVKRTEITDSHNLWIVANDGMGTIWNGNQATFTTWSTGHPYAIYSVVEATTAELEDLLAQAKTTAKNTLAELANMPLYTVGAAADEVDAVVMENNDLETALNAIDAIVINVKKTIDGKNVTFQNHGSGERGGRFLGYDKGNSRAAAVVKYDNNGDEVIWTMKACDDGTFKLYNFANNLYLGAPGSAATHAAEADAPSFRFAASTNNTYPSTFVLVCSNGQWLHVENGSNYKLMSYQSTTDGASLWTVSEVGTIHITRDNYNAKSTVLNDLMAYAKQLQNEVGLVTSGEKVKVVVNHPKGGDSQPSSNLLDGDNSSFVHSAYEDDDPNVTHHYIEVELSEATQNIFCYFSKRNNNNRPAVIKVLAGNSAENITTEVATLTMGESYDDNVQSYFSKGIDLGAEYTHLRFVVTKTNTGSKFFTLSEFYVLPIDEETQNISNLTSASITDADINTKVAAAQSYLKGFLFADVYDVLQANKDKHAAIPELGQYPTAAYEALEAAFNDDAATQETLETAVTKFEKSLNKPVYIITSAWDAGYSAGAAIYYDGAWKWKKANRYDKQMWMTLPGYTEEAVPAAVNAYDANNPSYGFCDYLTGTKMRGKDVQIVKVPNWEGAYSLQYATNGESTDAAQHAASGGTLVNWKTALANDRQASAWRVEYVGNTYDLDQLVDEQLQALTGLQNAFDSKVYLFDAVVGDGIGQYKDVNGTLSTMLQDLFDMGPILNENLSNLNDLEMTIDEINATAAKFNSFTVEANMPEDGKYYRIYGANQVIPQGYYITGHTNADGGRIALTAEADASTIYYYKDTHLQAYQSGKYIALNKDHYTFDKPAEGDKAAITASVITFAASPRVAGAYTIKSADRYLHYKSISETEVEVDRCGSDEALRHDWYLVEVEKQTITYIYKAGETELARQTVTEFAGMPYPASNVTLPWGYTMPADALTGNIPVGEIEKVIECAFDASLIPFQYANSYEAIETNGFWYYLKFDSDNNFYLHHAAGQDHIALDSKAVDKKNKDVYSWGFVGDPVNGYKIVNKAAGNTMILSSSTTMAGETGAGTWPIMTVEEGLPTGNNTLWIPTASTHATKGFFLAQKGEPTHRMNNRGSKLAYWTGGAGSGSTFVVEARPFGPAAELEELLIEAEELKAVVDANPGDKIGEYSEATATALATAIETAKAVTEATADDVTALENVVLGTKIILPTAGTYYQIHSALFTETKAVYSNGSAPMWKALNEYDRSFYWLAVETADGGIALQNAQDNKYMNGASNQSGAWTVSDTPSAIDVKILTKDAHDKGYQYGIILNDWQLHANGHNNGNGTSGNIVSYNTEKDNASAWYIVEAELPSFFPVTYKFNYGGETKYTQTEQVGVNGDYPAMNVFLPYGVTSNFELPTGKVDGEKTFEFDLSMDKALPFEAVAEGNTPSKWYYAQMHAFPGYAFYVSADENNMVWHGTNEDAAKYIDEAADLDDYLWGFVGDLWTGFKLVNKAGKAVSSTVSGAVTVVDDINNATKFVASNSDAAGEWFCMKYPTENNYLNLDVNKKIIQHWTDNDNGSSFFVTDSEKEYPLNMETTGYATFYSQYRVAIPEGVKAWVVSSIENNEVVLDEVTEGVLPANTGVILTGTGTPSIVTSAAKTANVGTNLLRGTVTKTLIEAAANTSYYVLANGVNGVKLYKAKVNKNAEGIDGNTHFYNNANKVYLPVETPVVEENGEPAQALAFRFRGKEQGTTEIEVPATNDLQPAVIYDLTGRRITEIVEKGIYIVNGKKVVIK